MSNLRTALYLAIDNLLSRLRARLRNLVVQESPAIMLSAYANVSAFIKGKEDIEALSRNLSMYEKASADKVNWGLKSLGIYLGTRESQEKTGMGW